MKKHEQIESHVKCDIWRKISHYSHQLAEQLEQRLFEQIQNRLDNDLQSKLWFELDGWT